MKAVRLKVNVIIEKWYQPYFLLRFVLMVLQNVSWLGCSWCKSKFYEN